MRGIKSTDKILEMKKNRFIKEVIIAATSRGIKPPAVTFDGELCYGYDGNQWAHYHPERHLICVPINMLRIMDEFQLKNTAIHEVSHFFDHTHDASFYQEMSGTGIAGLELPPGVFLTYEGMYKSEIKRDKRKERVDRTRCNYHSCRKRRTLTQCPHCDYYFCNEHISPYEPGSADNTSSNSAVRSRAYDRALMEVAGHACGEYIGFKKEVKEKHIRDIQKFWDGGRIEYLIPHDIICDYKSCNVKLKDERKGHLCRSCNMAFCKKHKELEDHECPILDKITKVKAGTESQEVLGGIKLKECSFCRKKIGGESKSYVCISCNNHFCEEHRWAEDHNCTKGVVMPVEKHTITDKNGSKKRRRFSSPKIPFKKIIISLFIAGLIYAGFTFVYPIISTLSISGASIPQTTTVPPSTTAPILTVSAPITTTPPPTTMPVPLTAAPATTPPATTPPPTIMPTWTPMPPSLEIVEQTFSADPNGRGILAGIVKNNAQLTFTDVQIEGVFFDETGVAVETKKSAPIGDLKPGETKNFKINPEKLIQYTDHYEINIIHTHVILPPVEPTTTPIPTIQPHTGTPTPTTAPIGSKQRITVFSQQDTPVYDIVELERQIHDLINIERQKNGLSTIEWNDELNIIAFKHSQDMADRDYFEHQSPEGYDFSYRYAMDGFDCAVDTGEGYYYTGGENLARSALYDYITYTTFLGTTTTSYNWLTIEEIADAAVQGWMNSPGHRENIVTPHWKTEGIGVAITDDYKVYATENFC